MLRVGTWMLSLMLLSGCARLGFKNSEFAYLQEPVDQLADLSLPEGFHASAKEPLMPIPAGVDHYDAQKDSSLLPPILM